MNTGSAFICTDIFGADMVIYFDYEITCEECAARTYGPPENCYPAESMEYNVTFTGLVEDIPGMKNNPPVYLEVPAWLQNVLQEYLENSNRVYDVIIEHQGDDDGYEYDEDYYRDR